MATVTSTAATIVGVDIFGPATPNPKKMIAFYRDVLGIVPTAIDESEQGAEFELADGTTFGVWSPSPDAPSGKGYSALFAVRDINAAVAEFRSRGARLDDPFETTVCYMSFGTDPEGNQFGIHQRK